MLRSRHASEVAPAAGLPGLLAHPKGGDTKFKPGHVDLSRTRGSSRRDARNYMLDAPLTVLTAVITRR